MLRLSLALCFVFTPLSWAAEVTPPSTAAQPPQALSGDQKAQILKLQRDMAIIDLDEKRAIEQVKEEAAKKRQEMQAEFQKLVQPLMVEGWSLNRDLEYVAAKPEPPKEK